MLMAPLSSTMRLPVEQWEPAALLRPLVDVPKSG